MFSHSMWLENSEMFCAQFSYEMITRRVDLVNLKLIVYNIEVLYFHDRWLKLINIYYKI